MVLRGGVLAKTPHQRTHPAQLLMLVTPIEHIKIGNDLGFQNLFFHYFYYSPSIFLCDAQTNFSVPVVHQADGNGFLNSGTRGTQSFFNSGTRGTREDQNLSFEQRRWKAFQDKNDAPGAASNENLGDNSSLFFNCGSIPQDNDFKLSNFFFELRSAKADMHLVCQQSMIYRFWHRPTLQTHVHALTWWHK